MIDSPSNPLFREQVTHRRRQRLYGDVILAESRASSLFVALVGALGLALIAWATTATYPRTEKVAGIVVTAEPSAKVFAARSGVIERVYVREGARVRRGQPLLFVGVDVRDARHRGAARDGLLALDRQSESIATQIDAARRASAGEQDRLDQALASSAAERRSLRDQADIQAAIVRSKNEELDRIAPAAERGFISRFELDRRRQSLLGERQRLEQIHQQLVQLDMRRDDLAAQLRRLPVDRQRQSAELDGQLGSLAQQRARAKIDVGYMIVAPIDGRVTALQAAAGRGADPRIPLMAVIPADATFRVRLFAPSKAVGFIRPGQPVRISYDAFPYRQFGTFAGEIASISRTAYGPGEIDTPLRLEEAVYPIGVTIADEVVPAFGRRLPLQSGMTLTANVILERRSFFDWLLQPLNAVRKRT